jgi:hypothetical protein
VSDRVPPTWITFDPEEVAVDVDIQAAAAEDFSIVRIAYSEETNNIEVFVRKIL